MLHLDIAQLQRMGLFRTVAMHVGWPNGARISVVRLARDSLRLLYRYRSHEGEAWCDVDERISITTTQQRLGGERRWFRCPTCERRVRILYAGPGFKCRQCHRLYYSSQSEGSADRANRGMFKIVKRLDPNEHFNNLPRRPKNMRWWTYKQLLQRYERYDTQWASAAMRRYGLRR
ncbi:MAG: hypothetical protein B7Z29_20730 [Hyphomicrobium sp. 12-62-95]|nr:MAG: hypothetical protein B7Z29_20730 [Hyphomicrobium sp. 12-62-95]